MAGTLTVDTIQSDSSYASTLNVASKINFTSGMQIGGQDTTFGGMRNRIINGDMRIDQRATTVTAGSTYTVDRWQVDQLTTAGAVSFAQSSTAPTGFTKSLKITVTSADASVASTDLIDFRHWIEGYNVADFGLGTAAASTFTLSFWVNSSLTGTYGVSVRNSDGNRVYVATYTINSANTWEQKTITIAGDTTGTWLTDNGRGLGVSFTVMTGSNFQGTAGVWGTTNNRSTSSQANLLTTIGATFYITGVQLEKGSAASAFENRQYGTELALCQRYLPAYNFSAGNQPSAGGIAYSTTATVMNLIHPVQTRIAPTGITVTGTFNSYNNGGGNAGNFSSITLGQFQGTYSSIINCTGGSGLVQGNATLLLSPVGTSQILLTGCEL
jgi:hypothetical protein